MLQFDHIKLSDSSGQLQIKYFDTPVGELSAQDTTWLRINQGIAKNIYTPRYFRADGGFFVGSTNYGISSTGIVQTDHIKAAGGQDLTITGGESHTVLTAATNNDEFIRLASEQGIRIYASSDNLTSGSSSTSSPKKSTPKVKT